MDQFSENKVMWSPKPMRETAIGKFMNMLVEKKVLSQPFGEWYIVIMYISSTVKQQVNLQAY